MVFGTLKLAKRLTVYLLKGGLVYTFHAFGEHNNIPVHVLLVTSGV